MPVTTIWHLKTGFENKENSGITCLLMNPDGQNWDGSWYSNLSDPFRNSVNWYLVFWLLDWVLEIRALSLPWAKFSHIRAGRSTCTVSALYFLPVSIAINVRIWAYVVGGVCHWFQKVSILAAVRAASLFSSFS